MTEMNDIIKRIFQFQPMVEVGDSDYVTIDDFHEWCCDYATRTFKAKTTHASINLFVMRRPGYIHILETNWNDLSEKRAVQACLRNILTIDTQTLLVCAINEVWVSKEMTREQARKYDNVYENPNHEDALMVVSEHRDGPQRMTKWVVKIKHNPANSRMLARDDVDLTGLDMRGYQWGWFAPPRSFDDDDDVSPS